MGRQVTTTPTRRQPYVDGLVALLTAQRGDRYVFGAEASWSDPNPSRFDCSELIEWGCHRLGVVPTMPDGASAQLAHCHDHGTVVGVNVGLALRGALLFRIGERPGAGNHVALSLGHGRTIEARGSAYGVNEFPSGGRLWTHAARIPGLAYPTPPVAQTAPPGSWYRRLLSLGSFGDDVARVQRTVGVRVDRDFGPKTRRAVIAWQTAHHLTADGVVGPKTARTIR